MPMETSDGWLRPYIVCCIIFQMCFISLFGMVNTCLFDEPSNEIMDKPQIEQENNKPCTRASVLSRPTEPDWPMFGKDKSHSHVANPTLRGIYEPTLKWDAWPEEISNSRIDSWGSTIGNFTSNVEWLGQVERNVKHVVYAEDGVINIVDGENGEFVWRLVVDLIDGLTDNDLVYTTPTLGYFDDDDKLDIIFGTTDGTLYMYEPKSSYHDTTGYENSTDNINADKVWTRPTGQNFTQSSPVLSKIDGDAALDLVVGSGDNLFAISGKTGNKLWNRTLPGDIVSSPIVYKDGLDQYVMVNAYNPTIFEYSVSFFVADSGARAAVHNFTLSFVPTTLDLLPSPAAAELDGNMNNDYELVFCTPFEGAFSNGRLYVYFTNRTLFWSTPLDFITGQIEATPAIGDLDGDGIPEIVIVSWNPGTLGPETHVYAFHGNNGSLAWEVVKNTFGSPPYINERAISSPILVDVDTDGKNDVVFTTSPNLYAVSGLDGTDLWELSLPGAGRELWSTPTASDIDKDGFLDVALDGAAVSHVIIDLTMTVDDLSFSSENITENQAVTIKAIIHNNGSATARNVKASFFENDILIGNDTASSIPGKDSREFRIEWTPQQEGERIIKIMIDPENETEEIIENNNEVSVKVNVIPSFPDLIVNSVEYYREDGKQIDNNNTHLIEGENATIKILVKNIGGDEGENVIIRAVDSGNQIADDKQIELLTIQQIKNVTYSWHPPYGNRDVTIQLDPEDIILEVNDSNNEYTEQVFVNSKDPSDPRYSCKGVVYQPDGVTPVPAIDVIFTNNRTKTEKNTITNSTGFYSFDLSLLPGQYQEGDEILIFASDGENETTLRFKAYSEDKSRFDNITLLKVPTYSISISVDSSSKKVYPNDEVEYILTITNRGNEENSVNLSISEIIDVDTNQVAEDWDAILNTYMVSNIPPKSSQSGIVLTVNSPSKPEDARANKQVLIAITAKSTHDPDQTAIIGMTTTIERVYDFQITIENPSIDLDPLVNKTPMFKVGIKNNGNDDDTVNIDLSLQNNWSADYKSSLDLLLGEEAFIDITLTCSESIAAGRYDFKLLVSSIDKQGNTSRTLSINILRADLEFYYDITMYPSKPQLSDNITFEAVIHNNGTSVVNAFSVVFRLQGFTSDVKSVDSLSPDELIYLSFYWTPTRTDNYLLEFEIDPFDSVIEGDEENNLVSLNLYFYYDIAITDKPTFSKINPVAGDKITISATIKNLGNSDINDDFTVDFYDGDPDEGGLWITQHTVTDKISVDDDITISIEWVTQGGDRQHTIYVKANSGDDFTESNYENNIVSETIFVSKESEMQDLTDYTSWIILIFIIGIIIIIFLFLTPSKQPVSTRDKGGSKARPVKGKSKGRVSKAGAKKARAGPKEKGKVSIKAVKFMVVDEAGVEEAEEAEVDEEAEDEEEAEEPTERETRKGKGKRRQSLAGAIASKLGSIFSGTSRAGKKKSTSERAKPRERKVEIKAEKSKETNKTKKAIEVSNVEEEEEEEEEEEGIVEVEAMDEEETEEEDDSVKKDEDRKSDSKGKSGKSEDESGWEYSQMIGIR